ncbi:hypothetical protein V6Z11_A10G272200 [Gossypium hirsutum]
MGTNRINILVFAKNFIFLLFSSKNLRASFGPLSFPSGPVTGSSPSATPGGRKSKKGKMGGGRDKGDGADVGGGWDKGQRRLGFLGFFF